MEAEKPSRADIGILKVLQLRRFKAPPPHQRNDERVDQGVTAWKAIHRQTKQWGGN